MVWNVRITIPSVPIHVSRHANHSLRRSQCTGMVAKVILWSTFQVNFFCIFLMSGSKVWTAVRIVPLQYHTDTHTHTHTHTRCREGGDLFKRPEFSVSNWADSYCGGLNQSFSFEVHSSPHDVMTRNFLSGKVITRPFKFQTFYPLDNFTSLKWLFKWQIILKQLLLLEKTSWAHMHCSKAIDT